MKQVWVLLESWNKGIVTESIESGVDAILTDESLASKVRELGRISIVSEKSGDIKIPDEAEIVVINNKSDENSAAEKLKSKIVIVRTTDWDIIPVENLIPRSNGRLFTFVRNLEDAKLAAGIMEKGVAGVVIECSDPSEISAIVKYIKEIGSENFSLESLEVVEVKNIGIGDRVCVDTCTNIRPGEGMLVGNSSQCLFLVHAENVDNPYVSPRPFRVNAGAVHSYVRVPGDKTRYLGELETGDPLLIVNSEGRSYISYVGRSKIEKRPMLVVYAKSSNGDTFSAVLQNAETIRLVSEDGKSASVVTLKPGDKVLAYTEKGGRHFGMAVDETIVEQ